MNHADHSYQDCPDLQPDPIAAWCRARAENFRSYEDHEMAMYPDEVDRDVAIVEWTVRTLANIDIPENRVVLDAIAKERAERIRGRVAS